jgi:hypothetical protein
MTWMEICLMEWAFVRIGSRINEETSIVLEVAVEVNLRETERSWFCARSNQRQAMSASDRGGFVGKWHDGAVIGRNVARLNGEH